MGLDQTVRGRLRAATAEAHARVDRGFSAFDWTSRAGYAAFLRAQAAALLPLERALDAGGAADGLGIGWAGRRRGAALLADLAALGAAVPEGERAAPIAAPAAALGTIYVLEGSRLGGSLIKRSVPTDFPAAFLAPGPEGGWRALLAALERALADEDLLDEAIAAARAAFARFERSAELLALRTA